MAEAPKDSDQSMEDILQSIKRIIADEGDVAAPASADVVGSDVLELTELLAEDVAVPEPIFEPEQEPEISDTNVESISIDDLMAEPMAAMPETPAPKPEPVAEFAPEPEPEPEPVFTPAPIVKAAPEPKPAPVFTPAPAAEAAPAAPDEKLMSDATLAEALAALQSLSHTPSTQPHHATSAVFRSGTTVEDLVVESLKPMLKEWIDSNLPDMVRSLVEREIRRISGM